MMIIFSNGFFCLKNGFSEILPVVFCQCSWLSFASVFHFSLIKPSFPVMNCKRLITSVLVGVGIIFCAAQSNPAIR